MQDQVFLQGRSAGRAFFALLLAGSLVGCGGKPATVSGIVTFDGKPVTRGTVSFTPTAGGQKAIGIIDENGNYELSTNRDVGLDTGTYSATVSSRERGQVGPDGGPPMPGKYLVPQKYSDANTSGLTFDVQRGSNEINIELTSEGAGGGGAAGP